MKFVHIADMHFDKPFSSLNKIENLGEVRRLEQRNAFRKMIEYSKENKIELLLIAGDLYEQEYVKESTIHFINELFKEIPETQIFISPGNHDPYLKNSYYATYPWSENVHIFEGEKLEKVVLENTNIYGFGFSDFYCMNSPIIEMEIEDKEKTNLLITHASLDGATNIGGENSFSYQPIASTILKNKGFDYVALGHIHKRSSLEGNTIIYPGSTISGGFDELGLHGMVVGEIENKKLTLEFVPLDEREFIELEKKMDSIFSFEELIEEINNLNIDIKKLCKLILTGKRNFSIEINKLQEMIQNKQIVKIKDKTKIKLDKSELKKLANEETLKGIFLKNMLEEIEKQPEKEEIIEKAIEIGLEALEG